MSQKGQLLNQKSLRSVTGKSADWNELAKDCIAFANATGGRLLLGIEDGQDQPPAGQLIPADLPDAIQRKLAERAALPWETQTTLQVPRAGADPVKMAKLISALRASDRVKQSVKEKTDDELLDHYQLAQGCAL